MNKTFNYWIFGISLILLGSSIYLNIGRIVITNESIVLVFVGILATFIVVGNYAQVIEIKSSTSDQIKRLEIETQNKINELTKLYERTSEVTERINEIERSTNYTAAEAYRLYGFVTQDKKLYKNSTRFLLDAISLYLKTGSSFNQINRLLDIVVKNLHPEEWIKKDTTGKFDYDTYVEMVKQFPEIYKQKQEILELLAEHQEANKTK